MPTPHFVSVERFEEGRTHYYVVHMADPKFTVEIDPEIDQDGELVSGTLRRVLLPNSWCGGYNRPARLLAEALEYLRATLAENDSRPCRFAMK